MNRQVLIVIAVVAAVLIGKKLFFPSDKELITRRLNEIAELLTKPKNETILATAGKISKSLDYFKAPVTVTVNKDVLTERTVTEQDKTRLKESLSGFKFRYDWVIVKFQDIVTVVNGEQANTTTVARLEYNTTSQGPVYDPFEITLEWLKADGDWFISKVDISRAEEK